MTKEMSGEFGSVTSKGESPSTTRETTSKQTTPVKVTKHVKKGCDTRIYKVSYTIHTLCIEEYVLYHHRLMFNRRVVDAILKKR